MERSAPTAQLDDAFLDRVTERDLTETLLAQAPIHVLVNNAGLAGSRGQTKDGFELAFGTNHLGHFLFTQLLLPHIQGPE